MPPPSQVDPKVIDAPSVSQNVPDVYNLDLDAEEGWNLSETVPSGKIDVHSRLQANFNEIGDKYVKYTGEALTAARVFELALHGVSTLDDHLVLLARVKRWHNTIRSSQAQIQSLQHRVAWPLAKLESMRSKVGQLKECFKAVIRGLSIFKCLLSQWESERDQSQTLVHAGALRRRHLEEILTEVQYGLDDD